MTFNETVNAAVKDFVEHGYDSQERLDYWSAEIRKAAEATATSPRRMQAMLADALRTIYARLVDNAGVLKQQPGVPLWTLQRVSPRLRDELDRRILASAELIKFNRDEAIEKTLRRFSGWATSIPVGGSAEPKAKAAAEDVKKSVKGLTFVERRVLVDQGHKLTSSISNVVAVAGGAIAGRWFSHWRQANYNYREDHKERDGVVYLIRGSWAQERGFVKPGAGGYTDQITEPGEEVFCFPGESKIPYAGVVEKVYRHWFSGELTEIVVASGKTLSATGNHPILTVNGWKAIKLIKEGDEVVEIAEEVVQDFEFNHDDCVPTIADIFGAVSKSNIRLTVPSSVANFHGDVAESEVDVVFSTRGLNIDYMTASTKKCSDFVFPKTNNTTLTFGSLFEGLCCVFGAAHSFVSSFGETLSSFWSFAVHSIKCGFVSCSEFESNISTSFFDNYTTNIKFFFNHPYAVASVIKRNCFRYINMFNWRSAFNFRKSDSVFSTDRIKGVGRNTESQGTLVHRFPFATKSVKVIKVNRRQFEGHVYNLQTDTGAYVANGIITHNCRCKYTYVYNLRDLPEEMLTVKGRDEVARVRRKVA